MPVLNVFVVQHQLVEDIFVQYQPALAVFKDLSVAVSLIFVVWMCFDVETC